MVTSADALPLFMDDDGDTETWSSTSLTYAFPVNASNYDDNYGLLGEKPTFSPMYLGAHSIFERAFQNFSDVSLLEFQEVTPGTGAQIDIAASQAGSVAWAYFPGDFFAARKARHPPMTESISITQCCTRWGTQWVCAMVMTTQRSIRPMMAWNTR